MGSDESVVGSSEVRRLEERVRELERLLGRKTMEVEILKEALTKAQAKKPNLQHMSIPIGHLHKDMQDISVFTHQPAYARLVDVSPRGRSECSEASCHSSG